MTARSRIDRADGAASRWLAPAGLAAVFVVGLLAAAAAAPYLFRVTSLQSEVAEQLRLTLGLELSTDDTARFDLLPHPRVVMKDVHVHDPSGTIAIDADRLDGTMRLLPLVVGRIELSHVTLTRPRMTIDLDGRPARADTVVGRALRHREEPGDVKTSQRLGAVTLVDGTAIVRSKAISSVPGFKGINVSLDWPELASAAALTGSMIVGGTPADISLWLAQPFRFIRGSRSAVTLDVHSAPADVSASGDISAATSTFRGQLSTNTPSLPHLLKRFGVDLRLPAPFANAALKSNPATITLDRVNGSAIDLAGLELRSDGNSFEGTLAYQGGARPLLSGTLAADHLSLSPFLGRLTQRQGEVDELRDPFVLPDGRPTDLDLRVSATHLRVATFSLDDAALSVMTRGDRTEVGLVDSKAYGGTLRGRMSFGLAHDGLNIRATGSLTGADAATLSWDAFGRQIISGSIGGSLNVAASGSSLASLARHLQGWTRGSVTGGEVFGMDVGRALREADRKRLSGVVSALESGRTAFTSLDCETRLSGGVATIDVASLHGPAVAAEVTGSADLADRELDLRAVASLPSVDQPKDVQNTPLDFSIKGSFRDARVEPIGESVGQSPAARP